MILKLKNWLSKLVKKSPSENEELANAVAFCSLVITEDNGLVVSADFKEDNEDAMAKIVFLLSSGVLMETIGNIVCQRCGEDIELRDKIIRGAYELMQKNLLEDGDEEDEDDDDPVVDPCNVFRQGKGIIDEHDMEEQ